MGYSIFRRLLPVQRWLQNTPIIRHNSSDTEKLTSCHKVDNLEKRFLVWTGKFKTVAEVPDFVSQSVMERARNRMRIKIANYMMGATILGCFVMIYLGKKDAEAGITIEKMNLDWHSKVKEDFEKSKIAASK
ncbi:UPF0389 protein CG9231 [Euwallacea fornicatus]|uniref:UPF0389 protein CG9231 n=1 Tax=Euwallacea fornicatus TaxID=995702 RepID=UPI00338EA2D8